MAFSEEIKIKAMVACGDGSSFIPQKSRQLYPH